MDSGADTRQAGWVFPFGNPRIKACLSAPRGLSQISTSFIAFYRLGIHHMRLFTWPYNPKHSLAQPFPFWNEKTSTQNIVFDHKLYLRQAVQSSRKRLSISCWLSTVICQRWYMNATYPIQIRELNNAYASSKIFVSFVYYRLQIVKEHRYLE